MLVKLKLIKNRCQIFHTNDYLIGPKNEMYPEVLEATVYTDDGKKKLAHIKRPNAKHYEKYEYKPQPPQDPIPPQEPEDKQPA